jgi:hypothetical protein
MASTLAERLRRGLARACGGNQAADLKPIIEELQAAGATRLRAIAALNERGIETRAVRASTDGPSTQAPTWFRRTGG